MNIRNHVQQSGGATVTIQVAGKLFHGHLSYLNQLIESAAECNLWPVLNLTGLEEIDQPALAYLMTGESRDFAIVYCPDFIRRQINHERKNRAA
jgi:hypothetical protein